MTNQQIQQPLTPVVIGGVGYFPCSQIGGPNNLDALYRAERAAKQELGIIEQSTNVSPRGFFRDGYVTRNYLVPTANLKRINELFDHPPGPTAPSEEELRQRAQRSKEASFAGTPKDTACSGAAGLLRVNPSASNREIAARYSVAGVACGCSMS